jgi:hypothetical protein
VTGRVVMRRVVPGSILVERETPVLMISEANIPIFIVNWFHVTDVQEEPSEDGGVLWTGVAENGVRCEFVFREEGT